MIRTATALSLLLISSSALSQDNKTQPMVKRIELIFMATKKIEGVTREKGFEYGEGGSIGYLHKEPAIILTPENLEKVELKNLDLSKSGLSACNYSIKLFLTEKTKKELAAKVKDKQMKLLTLLVDGKRWGGMWRYEVDETKRGVPDKSRASTFLPTIGYFSSKEYAESIFNALK